MTSKEKRVHYERGTKGGKSSHSHRNSRDSGVGSSSASDRASLGTSPHDGEPFSRQDIASQRHVLSAVQEALDAANARIRQLERDNAKLNDLLTDSNKENRLLKREKKDLNTTIDHLTDDLKEEKKASERARRDTARITGAATTSRAERRTTPPSRDETSHGARRSIRRESVHLDMLPVVPQPPYNPSNPFSPATTTRPSVSYPAASVTYSPAAITYTASPTSEPYPHDGRYHPYPL